MRVCHTRREVQGGGWRSLARNESLRQMLPLIPLLLSCAGTVVHTAFLYHLRMESTRRPLPSKRRRLLPSEHEGMPNSVDLSILHEDNAVIAVNKPSGLLSVPGRVIKDSVATRVSRHVKADRVDKLICHRLDQMTSGVMLFAKTDEAQRDIYEQFRKKKVRKRYAAVVDGLTHCCEGEIRLPLVKDYANPPTSRVDWRLPSDDDNRADTSAPAGVKTAKSKRSITLWRVLRIFPDINASLLELTPITGRSHQLRVHLSAIGHPILGDDFYAPREAADRAPRLMLHAHTLELTHPVTTAPLHLCADATDIAEWLRGHACCDG